MQGPGVAVGEALAEFQMLQHFQTLAVCVWVNGVELLGICVRPGCHVSNICHRFICIFIVEGNSG